MKMASLALCLPAMLSSKMTRWIGFSQQEFFCSVFPSFLYFPFSLLSPSPSRYPSPHSLTLLPLLPQVLPWLQYSALKSEEEDRKERVMRLKREKDSQEGKGFGPPPKQLPAKPYVSSYDRNSGQVKQGPSSYYCEVCEKSFNGPKPYSAHMASRAHREEVEVQAELRR